MNFHTHQRDPSSPWVLFWIEFQILQFTNSSPPSTTPHGSQVWHTAQVIKSYWLTVSSNVAINMSGKAQLQKHRLGRTGRGGCRGVGWPSTSVHVYYTLCKSLQSTIHIMASVTGSQCITMCHPMHEMRKSHLSLHRIESVIALLCYYAAEDPLHLKDRLQ